MSDMDHSASHELMRAMDSMMPVAKSDGRTQGKVTKVEPDGTVWVALRDSRGIVEMPCKRSVVAAKPGDTVAVTVRERRATIEGNYTSPATDDSKAIEAIKTGSSAQQTADMAHELATNAIADAQAASDAAERAEADATRAAVAAESSEASARASAASAASSASSAALSKEAADRAIVEAEKATAAAGEAYRKAEEAGDEAIRANSYAVGALNGLSAVQDVMGVIEWARDNGEFVAATGDFDPTATYFVADPEGNYTDGTNRYSVVAEPDADSFAAGDYYVLDVSEAMADFVNSHLAVADEGLYVSQQLSRNEDGTIDFCGNSYVLITPTGFEVYDSFGRLVTKYGAEMVMGNEATKTTINSQYLELNWTHDVMTDDGLVTVTDNVFSVGVKEEGDTPSLSFMNGSVFFGRDGRTIICNGRFEMQPNGDAELDNGEIKMSIEGREFRVRRYQEVRSGDVIQEVEERLFDVGIDDDGKRYLTFAKGGRSQNGSTPEAVTALFSVDDDGTPTFAKPVPIPSGGTDATNEGDAADNLMVQSIGAGMEIPAGTDLNTLTTPGNYVCGFTSNVAGFANKPTPLTNAFRLTVFKVLGNTEHSANEGHRGQLIMDWTSGREYYRVYNGSSKNWGSWRTKRQDTDVIDVLHGGHGGTTVIQARDNLKLNSIRYTTTASSAGYIKIKINSKTSWMLAFDVSLYQSYKNYVIRISGYNYSTTGTWHAPAATMVSASENEAVTVYFGHDSANDLWVAFPAGQYTGVEISAVTNGYTNVLSTFALQDLFTITRVTSLSGTTDKTVAVRRPVYRGEALAISEYGTGANTAAGAYKNITGQTRDFDTNNTADIWVPVFASGKVQHREIPAWFNSVYWNDFWQSLTSVASSGQSVHVVRRCNVVTIRGDNILIATSSDKADMPICNIPAGYRPPCTVDCIANNGQLWLASNGNLTVAGSNRDGRRVYFNVTYTIA